MEKRARYQRLVKVLRKKKILIFMSRNINLNPNTYKRVWGFLYIKNHCTEPSLCKALHNEGGIETLDFIIAKKLDFLLGQVCKYIVRAGKKDPAMEIQDLKKARFYLDWKINLLKGKP